MSSQKSKNAGGAMGWKQKNLHGGKKTLNDVDEMGNRKEDKDEHDDDDEGEEEGEEASVCQGYCHFNSGAEDSNSFTLRIFHQDITVVQDPNSNVGHGAVVWDAAVVMAKWLEHCNPKPFQVDQLERKRVLELGSGCGLGGITFMLKGANVTFTDMVSVVETILADNVNRVYKKLTSQGTIMGGLKVLQPTIFPIDWTFSESEQRSSGLLDGGYDYILLTDCVFSATLAPYLVATILRCSHSKTVVLCCHEIRDEEANAAFIAELGKYYSIKRIPRSKLHPEYCSDLIEVLTAKLHRSSSRSKDSMGETVADLETETE